MRYKRKHLIFLFFLSFAIPEIVAQNEEKVNILIVPFDRFSFLSQFPLEELAAINQVEKDSVYVLFKEKVVRELSIPYQKYHFFELREKERRDLLQRLPQVYKTKPTTHMGFEVDKVVKSGYLKRLLKNFSADYILLFNHYELKKKMLLSPQNFEGSKFIPWSSHNFAYEVFDPEGNLIALDENLTIKPNLPNQTNYMNQGLMVESLSGRLIALQLDILLKIEKYKGKAVYRLKNRDYKK